MTLTCMRQVAEIIAYSIDIYVLRITKARHDRFIPPLVSSKALRIFTMGYALIMASITLIKLSICTTLLRFKQSKIWRALLYGLMIESTLSGITGIALVFLMCRPMKAQWNLELQSHGAKCWTQNIVLIQIWIIGGRLIDAGRVVSCVLMPIGFFAGTDLILALMPYVVKVSDSAILVSNVTVFPLFFR
jgi:hypothetical protein